MAQRDARQDFWCLASVAVDSPEEWTLGTSSGQRQQGKTVATLDCTRQRKTNTYPLMSDAASPQNSHILSHEPIENSL